MRRAVGRASPVVAATSLSDSDARPGRKAAITSRPRASDSMKSGPLPGRGMSSPSHQKPSLTPPPRRARVARVTSCDRRADARPNFEGITMPDQERRPVVLRGGTVLVMDDAKQVLTDADLLVDGDTIAAVGPRLEAA